ncbi:unnamed protein product [Rotaria sordida]|uniref:N-acetyltransferase domain-containing protein n=1 Tax=Rotaria sordida TaxID=392033 RepID=A0A818PJW1_9BILA|nr:unnamed protein product [Rotaria sordida]
MDSTQSLNDSKYFLKTKRIGFRLWTEDDFQLALNLWGDNAVTKLIGGPLTIEKIQERFSYEIKNMKVYGVQYWPIFVLETGEHIGCCGFRPYDKEKNTVEIGFHILPKFWRQGFAREAADAAISYTFCHLNVTKNNLVTCIKQPNINPSANSNDIILDECISSTTSNDSIIASNADNNVTIMKRSKKIIKPEKVLHPCSGDVSQQ